MNSETISLSANVLSAIILSRQFDAVHCHDVMATWAAIRARRKSGRPFKIISTVHGPVSRHMIEEGYAPDAPDVKKVISCEGEAWAGADAIIAVDMLQGKIIEGQGADARKIAIIPNAVDIMRLDRIVGALPITRKGDRAWIFSPRRLTPKNGIEFAIRAMERIVRSSRPLLIVAGDGKERQRLEHVAAALKVTDDVVFLGNLEHETMLPIMNSADMVLIPSVPVCGIEEATSIAAIEAMALGKPVIASAIGGLKEVIEHKVNGILIPPADPVCLAEAVAQLLQDPIAREQIGKAARLTVEKRFSSEVWFEKHLKLYADST